MQHARSIVPRERACSPYNYPPSSRFKFVSCTEHSIKAAAVGLHSLMRPRGRLPRVAALKAPHCVADFRAGNGEKGTRRASMNTIGGQHIRHTTADAIGCRASTFTTWCACKPVHYVLVTLERQRATTPAPRDLRDPGASIRKLCRFTVGTPHIL